MTTGSKKKSLGRGLSALMQDIKEDKPIDKVKTKTYTVPIESLRVNPEQPRRHFNPEELENLTASIVEKGIIQPIIVRPFLNEDDVYQIVAGERRWRAAQKAALYNVPVVIYELDDNEVLEYAIIENVQRTDLNPIEEAMSYQHLIEKCGHTQEKLSSIIGKSRSHLSNILRLLNLPEEVKEHLVSGTITIGHARALLSASDPILALKVVLGKNLSVRETENLVKKNTLENQNKKPTKKRSSFSKDADTLMLESDLSAALDGMPVVFENQSPNEGQLKINYRSLDELDEVCRRLSNTI